MIAMPVKSRSYEEEQAHRSQLTKKAANHLATMGIKPPNIRTDENYYVNNLDYQERLFTLMTIYLNAK